MVIHLKATKASLILIGLWVGFLHLPAIRGQQASLPEATPQRPTFTNDASTAAPGTLEIEFGAAGPANRITLPTSFKLTPPAERGFFHQMEFSLSFDTLEQTPASEGSEVRFGDSLDLAIRRPVWSRNGLSFAVAPRVEFPLRDNEGARIGGKWITVYGFGLNSVVVNLLGLSATSPSDDNPQWVAQISGGYARTLGSAGTASKFSMTFEVLNEFSKGQDVIFSLLQALSFRAMPNLVVDVAVEQRGLRAGVFELVAQGGVTYNFGYFWAP